MAARWLKLKTVLPCHYINPDCAEVREFERHLSPSAVRTNLALWAFVARRPSLYRLATRAAALALGLLGGRKGRFRSLPLANGWTTVRDLPAPEGRSFHNLWVERQKGGTKK